MSKKIFLTGLTVLFINILFGQMCTCESNFLWVKQTFEENDAGFQYTIDAKGKTAYETHNMLFLKKVKGIKQLSECQKALSEWLIFFRPAHLGISLLEKKISDSQTVKTQSKILNWETANINIEEFNDYINEKKDADLEGTWESGSYVVGVKKYHDSYKGFIIKSGAENWKKNEIKFKIALDQKNGTYFMRDKSSQKLSKIELVGNNHLQLENYSFKRLSPKFETEKNIESYFKVIASDNPFIEELNNTTLLLRIPSFDGTQRRAIDSVIAANRQKIIRTENLIIDVRNNGGGNDESYKEIIPIIYTNPIRIIGIEMLSTKLNNKRMLDFISNPEWGFNEEEKKWAKKSYDILEKQLGKFVNLDTTKVTIEKQDTIYPMPKNVGIIINKGNGSTTEQFLLACKQSKKVKLFGTTTYGVLDISNMNFVKSPCSEFEFGYSLSKSYRIPDLTLDSKGIQPDYYIDKEIKDYDWIEYVNKVLNQK